MKHLLYIHSFLLLILTVNAGATIYIPTPLEDQVKDSYGVVRGIYQGKVFKKNSNGDVLTEISISLKETAGLKPGDIINKNNFKVTFPGGYWQGIHHKVSGSPEFEKSEDVILLIYRGPNGFHLLNFGLGKYSLERNAGLLYLNNAIFPNNSKISGVPLRKFQTIIENRFGQPLTEFKGEKFVYKAKNYNPSATRGASRAPSSIEDEENSPAENSTTMFWLMLILAVLGTSSYRLFNRKG